MRKPRCIHCKRLSESGELDSDGYCLDYEACVVRRPLAGSKLRAGATPDYDDVIAHAKDQGHDPYLPSGEYDPKVIDWASSALSQETS